MTLSFFLLEKGCYLILGFFLAAFLLCVGSRP